VGDDEFVDCGWDSIFNSQSAGGWPTLIPSSNVLVLFRPIHYKHLPSWA
jgi:hypothetical protein